VRFSHSPPPAADGQGSDSWIQFGPRSRMVPVRGRMTPLRCESHDHGADVPPVTGVHERDGSRLDSLGRCDLIREGTRLVDESVVVLGFNREPRAHLVKAGLLAHPAPVGLSHQHQIVVMGRGLGMRWGSDPAPSRVSNGMRLKLPVESHQALVDRTRAAASPGTARRGPDPRAVPHRTHRPHRTHHWVALAAAGTLPTTCTAGNPDSDRRYARPVTVQGTTPSVSEPRSLYSVSDRLRGLLSLTKPRIVELLLVTTVPTMFLASTHLPSAGLVVLTVVGGALAAGGANALNMVYDRDIDAVMERTRNRPLVTGVVSIRSALVFAASLELLSFILLATTVNLLSAVLAISAAAFYVGVYTMWLKRSSRQNIVIGGAAGAAPVLIGWSAVTDHLGAVPWILFGIVFLWTPPHFWALALRHRDDYAHAHVPMLPSVAGSGVVTRQIFGYTLALWGLSLALFWVGHMGLLYLAVALVLGAAFTWHAVALLRQPTPKRAMQTFGFSITYLMLLFVAIGVDAIVRHP
jgi:heme o synthase